MNIAIIEDGEVDGQCGRALAYAEYRRTSTVKAVKRKENLMTPGITDDSIPGVIETASAYAICQGV